MSKSVDSVPVQEGVGRAKTLGGRIAAGVVALLIFSPMVYGFAHVFLSGAVNRAFHYEKQCTISAVAVQSGGLRSYSSSSNIYIQSPDCSDLRFVGDRHGLTRAEVAERIGALAGQRVAVDVGVWQTPFAATDVVGFEGLDLGR